jgi:TRAP-type mannitol/chloroaromatic compound transport system substrate-binding protein
MRIPGLGGKVLSKAGATVVLLAGCEIYTSLERGVIDATEWVGPLHDLRMGFYQAAKYYYYPGWHELCGCMECIINKKKYDELPKDLQLAIDMACTECNALILSEFEAQNGDALQTLVNKHKVQLKRFPEKVLRDLRKLAEETLEEEANKSKQARKVHEAFKVFKKKIGAWGKISERAYYDLIG